MFTRARFFFCIGWAAAIALLAPWHGLVAAPLAGSEAPPRPASAAERNPTPLWDQPLLGPAAAINPGLKPALERGHWTRACGLATDALARQQGDLESLGVFAVCAGIGNDPAAAHSAMARLREVEPAPHYYATLSAGLLDLRAGSPDKAHAAFSGLLDARPGDPLANHFNGEALHALKRDPEALSAFRATLKRWPDYAPAASAAAQMIATPRASKAALEEAITLAERATKIEPMNPAYWKLLADLCERSGQRQRAAAIRLQWLNPPKLQP